MTILKKIWLTNILVVFLKILTVKGDFNFINKTLYYTFPPLYHYDDYDYCLYENPSKLSAFCITDIEIMPNNQSKLWKNIEEFSRDKYRHFRHDSLIYGICVNWCENMIKDLTNSEKENLYNGLLTNKKLVNYIDDLYSKETANRIKYNKIINQCLNKKIQQKYNLSVTSNIKYCVTNRDKLEFDSLDVAFVIVTIILLTLNLLSTFYDLLLKRKLPPSLQTNQYYKELVKDSRKQLFLSFSVCRNYFRLTRTSHDSSDYVKDLRFLDCFKFFMMLGVISSHLMELQIVAGLKNTEYLENFLHTIDKNILINATGLMQCFFQISGFLVMIGFDNIVSKIKKEQIQYIPLFLKMIILRYVRLTPLLAYGIFFSSSILTKLGKGPLWRFGIEREKVFCRRNWWINLLYVQNHVDVEKSCMPQSWYIAVDLQAFIFCALIMILCHKYPHKTKIIFAIPLIIATLSPALTVFLYNTPGLYFHAPEYFRQMVYTNDEFKKLYIPFQNNIMGYIFGIITGKLYLYFKSKNFKMSDSKIRIVFWYIIILLGFSLIFSAEIYYKYDVPKILAAIHGSLFKFLYAALFTYYLIGITDKIGWMAYEFASLPLFRVLGRLTYSVLIVQLYVISSVFSVVRVPEFQNDLKLAINVLGMIGLVYVIAFLVTIIIELPITAILKIIFGQRNQKGERLIKEQNDLSKQNQQKNLNDNEAIL